jgi:hypothetical protein
MYILQFVITEVKYSIWLVFSDFQVPAARSGEKRLRKGLQNFAVPPKTRLSATGLHECDEGSAQTRGSELVQDLDRLLRRVADDTRGLFAQRGGERGMGAHEVVADVQQRHDEATGVRGERAEFRRAVCL